MYGPNDYSDDFGVVDAALRADPRISSVAGKLIGPSISGNWKLEDVWDTGFIDKYRDSFAALSVEKYASLSSHGSENQAICQLPE
jgi:hypothetical protein